MFNFSMYPVRPFLQTYISTYCIMEFTYPEALSYVYTAKTESVLMFPIGVPVSPIAIQFNFPNSPDKKYTFYSHQSWLGGLLTEPNIGQLHISSDLYNGVIFNASNFALKIPPSVKCV